MAEVIEKIAVLLGVGRESSLFEKRKKKIWKVLRENDTITLSSEARRLSASSKDELIIADEEMDKF